MTSSSSADFEQARACFMAGVQHMNNGRDDAAETAFRAALAIMPDRVSVLTNLSAVCLRLGKLDDALSFALRAQRLEAHNAEAALNAAHALVGLARSDEALRSLNALVATHPDCAPAWALRGELLHEQDQAAAALQSFERALALQPDGAAQWSSRAVLLGEMGRVDEALASVERALALNPDDIQDGLNRAALLARLRRPAEALSGFEQVLRLAPDNIKALHGCSAAHLELQQYAAALRAADQIIALDEHDAQAWGGRGMALCGLQRFDEALSSHEKACALAPDAVEVLMYQGNTLAQMQRFDQAQSCFARVLARDPLYADAWYNQGCAQAGLGRHREAIASFEHALVLEPAHADSLNNRGISLGELCRYEEALDSYQQAYEAQPDLYDAYWNEACARLTLGQFEAGWQRYEYRWRKTRASAKQYTYIPELASVAQARGQRVLVWHEQGFGDTLQFARYAVLLAQAGASVSLEVQPALRALMAGMHEAVNVLQAEVAPGAHYDYQIPLLSLPGMFATDLASIPAPQGPWRVAPAVQARWAQRLAGGAASGQRRLRVGLAVSGSLSQSFDPRPIALQMLGGLAEQAELYLIQTDLREADRAALTPGMHWLGPEIRDFQDTAAIVREMDLVISICTSLVHLAGSLGVPTWVMLPFNADWRWLRDRSDSPWYPSVRLFRQSAPRDWRNVVSELEAALPGFAARLTAAAQP